MAPRGGAASGASHRPPWQTWEGAHGTPVPGEGRETPGIVWIATDKMRWQPGKTGIMPGYGTQPVPP